MLEPVKIKGKSKVPEARENAGDQVAVGFSFVSDWLRKWRELSGPITEQSEATIMQYCMTFDTFFFPFLLSDTLFTLLPRTKRPHIKKEIRDDFLLKATEAAEKLVKVRYWLLYSFGALTFQVTYRYTEMFSFDRVLSETSYFVRFLMGTQICSPHHLYDTTNSVTRRGNVVVITKLKYTDLIMLSFPRLGCLCKFLGRSLFY